MASKVALANTKLSSSEGKALTLVSEVAHEVRLRAESTEKLVGHVSTLLGALKLKICRLLLKIHD